MMMMSSELGNWLLWLMVGVNAFLLRRAFESIDRFESQVNERLNNHAQRLHALDGHLDTRGGG
jgi:hypothetical protein